MYEREIAELRERIQSSADAWDALGHIGPGATDEHLLTILRLRTFDVDRAAQLILDQVAHRRKHGLDALADMTASDVLGCDESVVAYFLPSWCDGIDRNGHPAYWIKMGRFEIHKVLEHTTFERLQTWHFRERELMMRALRERNMSTITVVIDMSEWHLSLMTPSSMRWVTSLLLADTELLAAYVGRIAILNVPFLFSITWAALSPFMTAATHQKITLVSSAYCARALLTELFDVLPDGY